MPRRRGWGFTLLELVVATLLIGLVFGAVVALFGRGMDAWARGEGQLQQLFLVEKELKEMGRHLRNGIALTDALWEGRNDEIAFLMAEDPTHLVWVRYRMQDEGGTPLWVEERKEFFVPSPEEAVWTRRRLLSGVSNCSFWYGFLKEEDGSFSLEWKDRWEALPPPEIPRLIRIQLTTTDSQGTAHSIQQDFWIPNGVLRNVSLP